MPKPQKAPPTSTVGTVPIIPPLSSSTALEDDSEISSLMNEPLQSGEGSESLDTNAGIGKQASGTSAKISPERESQQFDHTPVGLSGSRVPPVAPLRPVSPFRPSDRLAAASPNRAANLPGPIASPAISTISPRPHSPASSQIFERSVQDEVLPAQASPQIPSHIITENHIPPVLEEASAAITDEKLDPDSVEIVTHTLHQPASLTVTGTPAGEMSLASSVMEEPSLQRDAEESRSNIASAEAGDVRRLSFVSFADVVHGEHAAESGDYGSLRDSVHLGNLHHAQRSPSPIRSPASSHALGTSPPTSISPSFKPIDSPPRQSMVQQGSSPTPPTNSPPLSGELNVETMRQALQKTSSDEHSTSGGGSGLLSAGAYDS